ncbi:hypothetical protein MRB53_025144 [Persea americana]|uniref:Uncharacterized protein n=1 Tax=Persea americana TaxID=3435 RepID=A0ACC2LF26_PERAE|nr:hypothetical protein MRB53_025144 [Persea americana]
MGSSFKHSILLSLLLAFIFLQANIIEARTLTLRDQKRDLKLLESLGVMCRCCDGIGGKCKSSWDTPCLKLDCSPWKSH